MPLSAPMPSTAAARNALARRYRDDGRGAFTGERLVVLLYERLLADVDGAAEALSAGDRAAAGPKLVNAQAIVDALDTALQVDAWSGGAQLQSIYTYVCELLVQANVTGRPAPLAECRRVLQPLCDAWRDAWRATTQASLS